MSKVVQLSGTAHVHSMFGQAAPAAALVPAVDSDADAALVENYRLAKDVEREAIANRRAAQAALAERIGVDPEGAQTQAAVGGFECTTRASLTRSVTTAGAEALRTSLPEALFARLIRFKPEVDARELNFIKLNEPALYHLIAQHVTVKLGAAAVEVKP